MKLLLGTLLLLGVCWLGAAVIPPTMLHFDNERIAKAWYPLLTIPTGQVKSVVFPPFRFVAQPNGNLKYSIRVPQSNGCTTQEVTLIKQGQLGDFASNMPSVLRFMETDYETYLIAYTMQSPDDTFLALAGSQPTLMPGMEARLRAVANKHGITEGILRTVLQATC